MIIWMVSRELMKRTIALEEMTRIITATTNDTKRRMVTVH